MEDNAKVTYIGETDSRNRKIRFGIKKIDRSRHMYTIGKTGMGKSTLLENMAVQDIQNGDGLCFIDPHGKSADLLLEYVPKERIQDVIYFAPFDMDYPVSFNVMEDVGPEKRYLVASGMMAAFKKIWVDAWSARMEYILGNIMLALLEYPGSTLVGVNRMLTDKDFRKEVVNHISDPSVKSFWVNEYANYTDKFAAEAAPAIQNKVGQFVANPLIRNIIGQAKSSFDIREVMDNKKILIINLSKGRVGEANANLLGSMLITKIYLGAMSRADLNEKQLAAAPNFYMYVDEFQSFANESFADILSEARKYKLNLCIAHQYIEQMTDEVRAAVFGNVGTMCIFRVGAYDAEVLEKEFTPTFLAEDIVGLQKYQMYLKLMIDGVTSAPFSASGLGPIPKPEISYVQEILDSSRKLYARPRAETEEELLQWIQKNFAVKSGGSSSASGASGSGGSSGSGSSYSGSSAGSSSRSASSSGQGYAPSSGGQGSRSGDRLSPGADRGSQSGSRPSSDGKSAHSSRPATQAPRSPASERPREMRMAEPAVSVPRPALTMAPPEARPAEAISAVSAPLSSQPQTEAVQEKASAPMPAPVTAQEQSPAVAASPMSRPPMRENRPLADRDPRSRQGATMSASPSRQPNRESRSGPSFAASRELEKAHAGEKLAESTARETEFRKAMSLSYLKPEPEKKESKAPKPENVAALRDALLAVMGASTMPQGVESAAEERAEAEASVAAVVDALPSREERFERASETALPVQRMAPSSNQPAPTPVRSTERTASQARSVESQLDSLSVASTPVTLPRQGVPPLSANDAVEKGQQHVGHSGGHQNAEEPHKKPERAEAFQEQAHPARKEGEVSEDLLKGIFDSE